MAKISQIKHQGHKWAHLRREYLNCNWTSDTKMCMVDVQGGDIFPFKIIFQILNFGEVITC